MNRQKIMTIAIAAGAIFLVFYWTHLAFNSKINSAKSELKAVEANIEKAGKLIAEIKTTGGNKTQQVKSGLLSFLQTNAEREGLGSKITSIKPKTVPCAQEAAAIRLDGLTYNEMVSFLRNIERFGNLVSSNIKISKRFDDEQYLNLVMDIIKQ
ncbi:MAG: hypothetical protein C0602_09805 [Denitrovibrio sp.]|nr:MAG: hypothetical protein C0602_09805 [Denitrovibrio sp.]